MRIFLFLAVYLLVNLYIGWNGSLLLSNFGGPYLFILFWMLFWILPFSFVIGRFRFLPGPASKGFQVIGSYYFAVMEFLLLLLPVADVAAWILNRQGFAGGEVRVAVGAVVIVLLAILLLRGSFNAWSPVVRSYQLNIAKQAGSFSEIRIALASDIHLGELVGRRHLRRLVDRINAMQPDMILLPGDVIDGDITPFIRQRMPDILKELKAPLGMYAVLGNHEYYGGHSEEFVKQMGSAGIRVLRDESVLIHDALYVVGRKDKTAERLDPDGRMSFTSLLSELDLRRPVLAMDHQPYQFDKAAAAGVDLLVCGHTHRGQFAPNHWVTKRLFELDWGYLLKDRLHVIVSSGYGTWGPPVRLGSRSEIIEILIRFGQEAVM